MSFSGNEQEATFRPRTSTELRWSIRIV